MANGKKILIYGAVFITGAYFLFLSLVKAKPFIAPLAVAMVLAMLLVPAARWMEKKIKRVYTSLLLTFFLLLLSLGFMGLIGLQIQNFVADWDKAKQKIMPQVEQLEQYIYAKTPLQKGDLKEQMPSAGGVGKQAIGMLGGLYTFAGDFLLTLIYVFFLLNYRRKFRQFFLRLFPQRSRKEVNTVLFDAVKITSGYLYGKFLLMVFLAIMYAVGMGITGVNNFIIISLLAALLSIIPYIGNIIGFGVAIGLGYIAEGDTTALIGIVATFTVVQFVESYLFEPYVVGDQVNLDPLMTILSVVAGSLLWGVTGMILSVPILGMVNVIFSHIKPLKPYSYLLSADNEEK